MSLILALVLARIQSWLAGLLGVLGACMRLM